VGAEIFTNFCFFVHNFGYRYARKSFKGSKDADFGLVFKKSLAKIVAQWVGAQGQVKVVKKSKNTPICSGPPSEPQTENEKHFFSISSRRRAESVYGLSSSLAQSAGELWSCKN